MEFFKCLIFVVILSFVVVFDYGFFPVFAASEPQKEWKLPEEGKYTEDFCEPDSFSHLDTKVFWKQDTKFVKRPLPPPRLARFIQDPSKPLASRIIKHSSLKSKVNRVKDPASNTSKPLIVFLGGGLGLTGMTLMPLALDLDKDFEIAYWLPPGTFEPFLMPFAQMSNLYIRHIQSFTSEVEESISFPGQEVILVGHSNAGRLIAEIAMSRPRFNIVGLVFLASPLNQHTHDKIIPEQIRMNSGPDYENALRAYLEKPSESTYRKLIYGYGEMLTGKSRTTKKIAEDLIRRTPVSPTSMLHVRSRWGKNFEFEKRLSSLAVKKIGFLGGNDGMLPWSIALEDYNRAGVETHVYSEASHFVFLDNGRDIAKKIIESFSTKKDETK